MALFPVLAYLYILCSSSAMESPQPTVIASTLRVILTFTSTTKIPFLEGYTKTRNLHLQMVHKEETLQTRGIAKYVQRDPTQMRP